MINLTNKEIIGLFLLLKKNEDNIDEVLFRLRNKLEDKIFENLSIEELENIEELYLKNVDVLREKG